MKSSIFASAVLLGSAVAYPGMKNTIEDIHQIARKHVISDLHKRQGNLTAPPPNFEMIGDLKTKGATTPLGKTIQHCMIWGLDDCQNLAPKNYTAPGPLGSFACAQDTCCVWDSIARELVTLYTDVDGTCNQAARAAVRLGFHDAGTWSKTQPFGGADGSMVLDPTEILREENNGLQDGVKTAAAFYAKYKRYGVGAADLIQFMSNAATVICPLGPRTLTLVGRKDSAAPNPKGELPAPDQNADQLVDMFIDKSFIPSALSALVGAHSTGNNFHHPATNPNVPLDSTPGIWDIAFYQEVLSGKVANGTMQFPSDVAISKDPRTFPAFIIFANATIGQRIWNAAYAQAYVRLSLLGVNNINDLTDCTHVLPSIINTIPNGLPKPVSSSSASVVVPTAASSSMGSAVNSDAHPTGSASASKGETSQWTTSTLYSTTVKTITSCAPTVKDCPAHSTKITTEVVAVGTTVCPVSAKETEDKKTWTGAEPSKSPADPAKPAETKSWSATSSIPQKVVETGAPDWKSSSSSIKACFTATVYTTVYV